MAKEEFNVYCNKCAEPRGLEMSAHKIQANCQICGKNKLCTNLETISKNRPVKGEGSPKKEVVKKVTTKKATPKKEAPKKEVAKKKVTPKKKAVAKKKTTTKKAAPKKAISKKSTSKKKK